MAVSGLQKFKQSKELPAEASSAEESEESNESEEAEQAEGNGGWADSIAKVLNTTKPKAKKTLVLSRAKKPKVKEVKQKSAKEQFGFELAESAVKEQAEDSVQTKKEANEETDEKPGKRKNVKLPLRIKPTWQDIERERALRKVATRGVVQLFNAVRVQQKELQDELEAAGPLDSRRDAVLKNIDKNKFLDVLMSGSRAKSENVYGKVKKEDYSSSSEEEEDDDGDEEDATGKKAKKKKWSVLDSDFLTSKKAKHWDEEEESGDANMPSSGGSDSDEE